MRHFHSDIKTTVSQALLPIALVIASTLHAEGTETLQQAWDTALSSNRVIKATHEKTESVASDLSAARAVRIPSLSLESGYMVLDQQQAIKADLFGSTVLVPTMQKDSPYYKATVNVPIYTGGRIQNGIAASKALLSAAKCDEVGSNQLIKMHVAEAYVNVLRVKSLLALAQSHAASLESHAGDVEDLYSKGYAVNSDRLAIQVALADAREKVVQAQNALELAQSAYNRLLSRPLDSSVDIDDITPGLLADSCESMTQKALTARSELSVIESEIKALKHQAKAIRGERLPQVGLSGGYAYQENEYQKNEDQWYAVVGCKWNVFDGGAIHAREKAAIHQASALHEQYEEVASLITLQVRQAWLNAGEARKRMEVAHSAIEQAEANLQVVRDRYVNGLTTHTEYLDAETLRIGSETNYENALYDTVIADLQLKWASGQL